MSNFCSLLNRKERHYSDPGSREANDYQIKIDKKGHKVLEKTGTHDIYEEIQSYAEECKIENILARAAAGDTEILNQRQGYYMDITNTPATLAEAQNQILKLKQGFEELPPEIREKFDNSMEKFIKDYGTEEWAMHMGFTGTIGKSETVTFTGEKVEDPLTPEGNKE